jgi:hypothetical protein
MKNKKLTLIASIMIIIAMLCGSLSVAATEGDITTTTELETTLTEETTTEAPAEPTTTTEPTTELTTAPADETTTVPEETTTSSDGYYNDSDYETDEEKEAYDDGYWDGYDEGWNDAREEYEGEDYDSGWDDGYHEGYYDGEGNGYYDGYYDGYYEGYYEAIQDMENKDVVTIFDRWDAFIEDLRDRMEYIIYEIKDFFAKLFKTGDYAPEVPIDPDDSDYIDFIPEGFEGTLADDENAAAICEEFNGLINSFAEGVPADVAITKAVNVDVQATELPQVVQKIVQPVIENFLVDDSTTNYYYEGDWAYNVQSTGLMPQYLKVAEKTVNEDGTTDYRFEVIEEAAYYDGYRTRGVRMIDGEVAYYTLQHEYIADAIYVEDGYLDPITVTNAKIVYPGATVTAKTDAQGRLIEYDVNMPVKGEATGKAGFITATVSLSGYRNEGFVMDYDV